MFLLEHAIGGIVLDFTTPQLVAGAIALVIVWVVGRLCWRAAMSIAGPVEVWVDETFDAPPVAAQAALVIVTGVIFLALLAGIVLELRQNFGALVAFAARLVALLVKIKI